MEANKIIKEFTKKEMDAVVMYGMHLSEQNKKLTLENEELNKKLILNGVRKSLKVDFAKGEEVTFSYILMGEIEGMKEDGRFIINRDGQRYIVKKEKINKL